MSNTTSKVNSSPDFYRAALAYAKNNPEKVRDHLSDEEFVAYVMEEEQISEEQALRVDAHIAMCEGCAKDLEHFYENCKNFPRKEWEESRDAFVANLRERLTSLR